MSDDKVIPMHGAEDDSDNKKIDLERLNTLMGTAMGALQEATEANVGDEAWHAAYDRTKRLNFELTAALDALGVDVSETHMVRVKGEDGKDEQYEVTFPIYAQGDRHGQFRRIDSDMMEVSLWSEHHAPLVEKYEVVRARVDFLDGRGANYWLGRGEYALDEGDFEAQYSVFLVSIMEAFGEVEEE